MWRIRVRAARKYVQLTVVAIAFFSAVLIRSMREQGGQPVLAQISTTPPGVHAAVSAETATIAGDEPSRAAAVPELETPVVVRPAPGITPAPSATRPPGPDAARPTVPAAEFPASEAPTPIVRLVRDSPTYFGSSTFRDGSFTGKAIYTRYGIMQVTVVIRDGRIADVAAVRTPDATATSIAMSEELVPGMVAEAIATRDWNVDRVSGATITWQGFQRAMVYALRAAEFE